MGSVYNRLGSEVEVVEFADKILANFDNEVSTLFTRILKKQGVKFNLGHKVVGGSTTENGVKLIIEDVKVFVLHLHKERRS
jgi:dihydrolipoamide dehydrogenase